MKIIVTDPIANEGIELLRKEGGSVDIHTGQSPSTLKAMISAYDAIIVRSETQVNSDIINAGTNLQVIGRAGVGTDNIDVDLATQKGILVVNAPTSNIVAAAEHTLALMLSVARHVPQANAALKSGRWARKEFVGTEMRGKTLGIIGLGKVGTEVARRAKAFEMKLLAHDPFVTEDVAHALDIKLTELDQLLRDSDIITVHLPKIPGGKAIIGKAELEIVKPTVRIINAARGGIIDELALVKAIQDGKVAGAAIDTFLDEPAHNNALIENERVIVTPHLGASTKEAQINVSVEVAQQVLAALKNQPAKHAVNAPLLGPQALVVLAPFADVAQITGKMATQLAEGQLQVIHITYSGEIGEFDSAFLKAAIIQGLLAPISEERLNVLNADLVATQRGLRITERKDQASSGYRSMLTVRVTTTVRETTVAATSVLNQVHIVGIDDYPLDVEVPKGHMLIIENLDQPGIIGAVGTVVGENNVNISFMKVGRVGPRDRAIMAVGVDEALPETAIEAMKKVPGIQNIRQVKI